MSSQNDSSAKGGETGSGGGSTGGTGGGGNRPGESVRELAGRFPLYPARVRRRPDAGAAGAD